MTTLQQAVVGFSWDTAVDLSKKENRARLSSSAITGLLRIAEHWKLRDDDTRVLLGCMSSGSFYALNILYSQKLADAWIALPNTKPMFGGDSPLNYFKKGGIPALLRVRQLLDARRGGR